MSPGAHDGVWVAYAFDAGPYVISVHAEEVEALRSAVDRVGHVRFVKFGEDMHEALNRREPPPDTSERVAVG